MAKRISIASVLGFVCGIICLLLAKYAAGTELHRNSYSQWVVQQNAYGLLDRHNNVPVESCGEGRLAWVPCKRGIRDPDGKSRSADRCRHDLRHTHRCIYH